MSEDNSNINPVKP